MKALKVFFVVLVTLLLGFNSWQLIGQQELLREVQRVLAEQRRFLTNWSEVVAVLPGTERINMCIMIDESYSATDVQLQRRECSFPAFFHRMLTEGKTVGDPINNRGKIQGMCTEGEVIKFSEQCTTR